MIPRFKAGDLLWEPTNEETAKLPPFLVLGFNEKCPVDRHNTLDSYPGYIVLEGEQVMNFVAEYVDKNCEKLNGEI